MGITLIKRERAVSLLISTNPDGTANLRAAIAMSRIYACLEAARTQVRAIEALEKKADPKKPSYSSAMIQAFIQVHLYFICWAAIGRMIEVIRRCSGLEAPSRVWKKYRAELKRYAEARDHFEHYEERLPGGKISEKLINPGDYGSLRNGYFSLGGFKWDISPRSVRNLNLIIEELAREILSELRARPHD